MPVLPALISAGTCVPSWIAVIILFVHIIELSRAKRKKWTPTDFLAVGRMAG
jgi:hypothetical protein